MFLGYIHAYRALAILFIVGGHSIDAFQWGNTTLETLLRITISNGSILFVFIAGYLFQHLSLKYQLSSYFISKFKNVLVPYFLISIPAIIAFVFFLERESVWLGFYEQPIWQQIAAFYLTGAHLAPLWFIPFISLVFLLSPLLIWADKKPMVYFLLPIFILISCAYERSDIPLENLRHFFSVYFLGMFCSHFKERINPIVSNYGYLFFSLFIILSLIFIEFTGQIPNVDYLNYLQKIIMSVFFLGLFIALGKSIDSKSVSIVANVSFGIFFIHSYILTGTKIAYGAIFGHLPQGGVLVYCLVTVFILLVSTLAILFIKRITGVNSRYIVGS